MQVFENEQKNIFSQKKRIMFTFLALVFSIIVFLPSVQASTIGYTGTCAAHNVLVCGSTPDSLTGRGAVDLCNLCYPCGVADGVCPEDFYSSVIGLQGSCSGCPDPDCTTVLSGVVKNDIGELVPGAKVYAIYDSWEGKTVDHIATTDNDGVYTVTTIPSGFMELFIEYEDYDSPTLLQRLVRGEPRELNFTIAKGTCTQSCTGSVGNRCLATCEGINGCAYASDNTYTSTQIATLCNQRKPGERIILSSQGNQVTYVTCCDENAGAPNNGIRTQQRSLVRVGVREDSLQRNLVLYQQSVLYNGELVRLVFTSFTSD